MQKYHLSFEGHGHTSDVRGICRWQDRFVTCSRDKTIRVWRLSDARDYVVEHTLEGHADFVNAVCAYGDMATGFLVSGSKDKTAIVWNGKAEVASILQGHELNVCAVAIADAGNKIMTGSWDKTAKVWDTASSECIFTLTGHEHPVWSVKFLPDGNMTTASADKNVRVFSSLGECTHTLPGHTDVCRSLVWMGQQLLSSGNDGKVRVLQLSAAGGTCLQEIDEHDGYPVYDLAPVGQDGFLSSSEDKNLRLFKGTSGAWQLVQTVPHPAVLWASCSLYNGDLATAGSDGVVRVWSQDPARRAPDEMVQAYDLGVASQSVSSKMVGQIDATKLAGPEALLQPGVTADQRLIINNGGNVEIHQWDALEAKWIKIGDVVDTEKESKHKMVDGREVDYMFDVDIKEGSAPLKIGFNKGEDPYMVAQQFIWKHELSQEFLSQIADWIVQQVGADAVGTGPTGMLGDPLTGGGRYIPGASSAPRPGAQMGDPLTGGGRYIPGSASGPTPGAHNGGSLGVDPLTGGGAYRSAAAASGAAAPAQSFGMGSSMFPARVHTVFETGNFEAMKKKLLEFNEALQPSGQGLDEIGVNRMVAVIKAVTGAEGASPNIFANQLVTVFGLLDWPAEYILPVLDLLRLVVRHKDGPKGLPPNEQGEVQLKRVLQYTAPEHKPPVRMLSLRFVCNLFPSATAKMMVLKNVSEVLNHTVDIDAVSCPNQNVRLAHAALLVNFSIELVALQKAGKDVPFDVKMAVLGQAARCLNLETEAEPQCSYCMALGTLLQGDATLTDAVKGNPELMGRMSALGSSGVAQTAACAQALGALLN